MMTRFTDNENGTVTDNQTGLMWAKDARGRGSMVWKDAKAYCEALNLAGFSDWRLPTRMELNSLLDSGIYLKVERYGRGGPGIRPGTSYPALPTGHPFIGVALGHWGGYWGDDHRTGSPYNAWTVTVGWGGGAHSVLKTTNFHYAWPVRGGQ